MIPDHVLAKIDAAPPGRDTVAFFDMDGTLVSGFTAFAFALQRMKRPAAADLEVGAVALRYQLGRAEFSELLEVSTRSMAGTSAEDVAELAVSVYEDQIASWVYPEARAIIAHHKLSGHRVVLVSAANDFQVRHVAADLQVDHIICNKVEVDAAGILTGEVDQPIIYGPTKASAALEYADLNGLDLNEAFFYSDGYEDLPLLDSVGNPQPLNPDRKLARVARKRGWAEASFSSRGRPTGQQLFRTLLSQASLVPAAAAGVFTGALNGSRRQAVNLAMSTWGDFAASLAGVDLEVTGEHLLWSNRPAVFMFNHQSNFDGIILMKLLRKDITAIAKAELRYMPIVGQLFTLGDVVFIDRGDHEGSVEALTDAAETLRDGLSIAIAPEGSRQATPKLGDFKKGGFHLAIAGGAPIVPVVIHNSLDVQPRGSMILRPATVHVDVLEPVATRHLQPEDVDSLRDEVRAHFARSLGQV